MAYALFEKPEGEMSEFSKVGPGRFAAPNKFKEEDEQSLKRTQKRNTL